MIIDEPTCTIASGRNARCRRGGSKGRILDQGNRPLGSRDIPPAAT
jgi:hypothetical protein